MSLEPRHPPFLPASTTQPRQLQRWLDVNAQGGKLTKTATYIVLPAFTVADKWNDYSDIVAVFNFEAPCNFALTLNVITTEGTAPTVPSGNIITGVSMPYDYIIGV